MDNIFEVSKAMPVKFYPVANNTSVHFDDDLFYARQLEFQRTAYYRQKWQTSDSVNLQALSNLPVNWYLYKINGDLQASGAFISTVLPGFDHSVHDVEISLLDVPDGVYYWMIRAEYGLVKMEMFSEPQDIRVKQPNTWLLSYTNKANDFGIDFRRNAVYYLRGEVAILDYDPKRDRKSFVDQTHNTKTVKTTPYRKAKMYVGDAAGVPEWFTDILGFIICCDEWRWMGKHFETPDGTELEITRQKGWPMVGASIDVVEAENKSSVQMLNGQVINDGLLVAQQIEGNAFGYDNAPAENVTVKVLNIG